MARLLKRLSMVVGGIIILSVIGIVIVLYTYDFNSFKDKLSKVVYDATGRELIINSDVDLDIGLSPSLVMSDIVFMNADWGDQKRDGKGGPV